MTICIGATAGAIIPRTSSPFDNPSVTPVFTGTEVVRYGSDTPRSRAWARHTGDHAGRRPETTRPRHRDAPPRTYSDGVVANLFRNVQVFVWEAGDGNDTLQITNPTNGLFAPATGIQFVTTDQSVDTIQILGGVAESGTYEIGAAGVKVTHTAGAAQLSISAASGTVIHDAVSENLFTAYATDVADTITVADVPGPAGAATRVTLASSPVSRRRRTSRPAVRGKSDFRWRRSRHDRGQPDRPRRRADQVGVFGDDGADTVSILRSPRVALTPWMAATDDAVVIGQTGSPTPSSGLAGDRGTGNDTLNWTTRRIGREQLHLTATTGPRGPDYLRSTRGAHCAIWGRGRRDRDPGYGGGHASDGDRRRRE